MRTEVLGSLSEGRGAIPVVKKVRCNDLIVYVYSIGWLSYWTKLAPVTLRLWQRKKILPEPVLAVPGNYRWYTSREVLEYAKLVDTHYSCNRNMKVLQASLRAVRSKLVGHYSAIDKASLVKYDASYVALPSQDKHEQAMRATKSLERSSAKNDFFLKVPRRKITPHETKQAEIKTDNSNSVRVLCAGNPPPNTKD